MLIEYQLSSLMGVNIFDGLVVGCVSGETGCDIKV